jgi:hypothetical protein
MSLDILTPPRSVPSLSSPEVTGSEGGSTLALNALGRNQSEMNMK